MSDEIKISKNTLLLFGLLIVSVVGFYFLTQNNSTVANPATTNSGSGSTSPNEGVVANPSTGLQEIYIKALTSGKYDNMKVTVKKGIPVRLHFSAEPGVGCGRALMIYNLNVRAVSQNGQEQVVDFTPNQTGTYQYSCGMGMWGPGKLIVV